MIIHSYVVVYNVHTRTEGRERERERESAQDCALHQCSLNPFVQRCADLPFCGCRSGAGALLAAPARRRGEVTGRRARGAGGGGESIAPRVQQDFKIKPPGDHRF